MANLSRTKKIAAAVVCLLLFLVLQLCLFCHAFSARTVTMEYLGREVCSESQLSREENFYSNGQHRWTYQIPPWEHDFRMHTATFEWNENHHVPPDASTTRSETWVGTCTLTPKSPWCQIDLFGILGPMKFSVYGDWYVEASQ